MIVLTKLSKILGRKHTLPLWLCEPGVVAGNTPVMTWAR